MAIKQKAKTMPETKAKREEFVRAYIDNDFKNAAGVYEKVYRCTARAAVSAASRLLKDVNVQALLADELAAVLKEKRIPLEKRILDTWMVRAFYDIADIVDTDGRLVDTMDGFKKSGLSVVIDGIDIKPDKNGDEHYVYKLADRDKALDMLQKYIQMIRPFDAKVTDPDNPEGEKRSYLVEFVKSK
jgi:hypothetical protein